MGLDYTSFFLRDLWLERHGEIHELKLRDLLKTRWVALLCAASVIQQRIDDELTQVTRVRLGLDRQPCTMIGIIICSSSRRWTWSPVFISVSQL